MRLTNITYKLTNLTILQKVKKRYFLKIFKKFGHFAKKPIIDQIDLGNESKSIGLDRAKSPVRTKISRPISPVRTKIAQYVAH